MANGIPEQRGLYGAFQQWYRDAKIPAPEVDLDRDGQAKPREVVAYVLSHLDKFSPKVQKQVDALRQAFRGLGFADAEAVRLLTGELKDGAHQLVEKGKDFEKKAAAAVAENNTAEAARLLDLAEKSYRLALDLRPHTRLAHQALADLLYRGGKTEAARGHVAQVVLRSGEKIPELMTWLQGLKDPEIRRQGAVAFAGGVLLKESEHRSLASLYEWASRDAAKRGDADQAKRYEEKCLLADELARPYSLDFTPKDNSRLFALYEALRRAGIPSGHISGNRVDSRAYHTITTAQLLTYVDRHATDPKVREALQSLGLFPPPWESSPFSGDAFFAGKAGFTEKLGAYHAKMATLAVTAEARFQHLEAALHYRPEDAETQLGMAHYYLGKNQLKEAEPYLLNALRLAPQTPGLQDTLKATQLNHMNHLGERAQADLREADALLAQGKAAAAEKLVKRAAQTSEARFDHHAKMLWEEPNHQLRTSRLDAQLKFQQARLLETQAKTAEQFSEAHFLYVLAESSAQVALSKDPKDAAALDIVARVGKIQVGQKQQGAALQEEREIRQDLDRADELLRDGKTEAAKKLLSKAAKALQARQDNHGRFFAEGSDFQARGARLEAELKFHQARALDGKRPAQGREAQDLYLQAEKAAAALLKQDPKDKVARRLLERLEQVRNLYKDSALKQDQEIHKGLRRVDALLAQGKTEEAQRLLQKTWVSVDARWNHHAKLLAENPYFKASTAAIDAELKFHHARILERQAQTQDQWVEAAKVYAAAEASATAWIERAPKDSQAHLLRARIRHVRENYRGAVEDYGSTLAKAPDAAAKERIALQWSFYLEELKNLKTELKRMRGLWKDMAVPPSPFDQYRLQSRELAVTRALQAVAGSGLDQGLWIPDPKLKGPQIAEAKIQAFQEIGKEVGELEQGVKNLGSEAALKTYHEGVNKVVQRAGLKTSDLPADLQNLVEIGPEGQVIFKPEPPSPAGTISVHGKSEVERKLSTLQRLDNLAFIRWNERQAATAADPVQKLFYETQALLRQDKIHATRLKMADFHAAVKAQVAVDPGYLEKNPEIGAMYEQTKLVLKEISLKSLDQLGEFNELNLAQRAAMEYVPKTTQAKLNKVMMNALRAEIESGRALTLDEAMRNLKAEYQRQKAAGEAFQVTSHNMIHPGTKFDALSPGRPETLAYLFDEYLGWEKDKGFKALLEAELRPGLEQRLSPDQDRRYSLELAKTLRGNSDYSTAAELLEKLFGKDLEAAKQKISPDRIQEIKTEVQTKDRAKLEKEIREAFKKNKSRVQLSREDTDKAVEEALAAQKLRGDAGIPGGDAILQKDIRERIEKRRAKLTEPLIQKALDQAVAAKIDLKIRSEAYGHMPNMVGSHDPIAQEAWKIFNDMKDPNDEWDNLADHSWDALKTEAIVMAVTLPMTLGVGTAVRAGMSGTKLAIRMLNAGRWASAATKGGILITGAAAEGLVQTFLASAIHNRDFEWKEVGFNIVTSLAFHGGNRLWGKFADKLGIGDRAIQAALQRGESVVGMKVGNFAGMMLVQTELSAAMNYALETIQGHPGPGFWTLERHLGEGVRQLAYHGGTKVLNIATRNWAANAELRAKLKAEVAQDHYQQLLKQGKLSAPEARKLAAERAHQEIPSVLDGQDPKQIGAMLAFRKANRLVEKLGTDPDSAEGKTLAYILQHANDLPGAEKALGEFKDLDGFVRERLNLDPTSQHGKAVMKQFAEALAHGKKSEALLKEFPELGRLLEAQEVAAKQLLAKTGMDKVKGQDALAKALVALALERGYGVDDLARFGEVLAHNPELLKNIVDKFGGDAKRAFSNTVEGRQLAGLLLVDAMRASPDFDAFAATLKNLEAHANYHLSDVDQAGLLLGGIPLSDRVALFRWSAREGRGQHEWSADLQGMLEGRVQFRIVDGRVERVEQSEAEGAGAQRATAKQFAALNDEILAWAHTDNFSAANQKLAMEGMADRVLRSAGYKPGSAEYRAHRDFLLKHFEAVARGETNPEDGYWPKVAVDLETHLRKGGTMTYLNKDGSQYAVGPAKPAKVATAGTGDATRLETPRPKAVKKTEQAAARSAKADRRDLSLEAERPATPSKAEGAKAADTPAPVQPLQPTDALAAGTRQAGEHLVGELFDYYHGKDTRETLAAFAQQRDAWGAEARSFQKELGKLEALWKEYGRLEKDYRKKPSPEKSEDLHKKWQEVQALAEGLHDSKYHKMERAHAALMLETQAKLAPLEIFLGMEQFPSLQQARQLGNERSDLNYELNFTPPEKMGAYADDWSRVPAEKLARMDVKVAGMEKAQELAKKMAGRGEFEIQDELKLSPDQKSGEMTVVVKNKVVEKFTDEHGKEQRREYETTQRVVIKFELDLTAKPMDQADPWAVSAADKVEVAPRAGEPAADRRAAVALPGLVAGLVTLLAPDLAHAADKAGEASGGGAAPWIVGATLLVLGGIGGLFLKRAKGKAAGQPEASPPLPQRRAVAWDQAPPQRPPLDAPRPAVETTPPRVPVVERVPEVFSTFKLGLEHRAIDLGVLPPKVQELDVFVGDPAKLSDKAGLAVVVQDGASSGEPVLRGKLRREGAGWIFYPVDATDVFGGNLQPKAPRPDGFVPLENHDYLWFGMAWFQVEGQTLRQAPGSPEVSLHFRDGTGHARAQADRVAVLPHPDQAPRDQPPAPAADPLFGAKALLAENEPGRPRRGTVLKTQATEEYGVSAAKTHEGVGKSYNEDGFVQGKDWALVIDEVGTGGSHGKAGKVFGEAVAKYMAEHAGDGPPAQVFRQALLAGGDAINASPYARSSVVAVGHYIVRNPDGSRTAVLVHVGDAVGMVIAKDGRIKHRSQDQSLVEELVEKNLAAEGIPATARKFGLHTDDVELMKRAHPRSNVVLGSLGGGKNTQPVVTEVRLEAGDRIVMMSDGVSDSLSSREIAGQALAAKNPGQAMDGIFNTAFGRMGSAHEAMGAKREWKLQWQDLGPGERIEVLRDGKKRYMRRDLDEATNAYVYSVFSAKEGGILIESFSRPLGLRTPITTPDGQQRWIDQNANIWDRQSGGTLLAHYKPSDNITVHVYFHETAEGGAGKTEAKKGEPPVPGGTEIPADARRLLETKGSLVLGRVGDWVLGSPQDKNSLISGRQATLTYKREGDRDVYELRDGAQSPKGWVASLNGTFVNGRRLPSGEAVTLKDGDVLQMGHEKITWTAPRKAGDGDLSRTITAGDWAIVHPHLYQAKQFTQENLLEGTPVNGLEVPGRSAVYMEGAGRYAEDPANREIIVWDRSQDVVVRDFLAQAQEQVRRAIGKEFLDPADPNFERDLQLAMSIYNVLLRKEFRDPGEDAKGALRRLDAFIADKRDQKILVGEMLKRKFPFCRHLALLTQAFLADLGVRKVQMVRGSIIGGAHVWNEVEIGGQRRVIEITDAFYAGSHPLLPPDINMIYHHEPRAGRVQ